MIEEPFQNDPMPTSQIFKELSCNWSKRIFDTWLIALKIISAYFTKPPSQNRPIHIYPNTLCIHIYIHIDTKPMLRYYGFPVYVNYQIYAHPYRDVRQGMTSLYFGNLFRLRYTAKPIPSIHVMTRSKSDDTTYSIPCSYGGVTLWIYDYT